MMAGVMFIMSGIRDHVPDSVEEEAWRKERNTKF
jgi:hypothetical protein